MKRIEFKIEAEVPGSKARATRLKTRRSEALTPLFMPVATRAHVRGIPHETLESLGYPILLSNTYHLYLRPGLEVFKQFGGIHKFMDWKQNILTDSGGFQVFSLDEDNEVLEDGVSFRSYIDGKKFLLTPQVSIEAQKAINSDIMMAFDQCVNSTCSHEEAVAAMKRTHRWARISLETRGESDQALFGIVQGACFEDLRRISAEFLRELPFDGMAIGGLAVGETKEERERIADFTTNFMPVDKPRYLMGVGTPADLLEAVHRGCDMFDCILPNALGQQGVAFTRTGRVCLTRGVYRTDESPLDKECGCNTCRRFTRSYLHYLVKSNDYLACNLVSSHNLYFYKELMDRVRASILDGSFLSLYESNRHVLDEIDAENPSVYPVKKRKKRTHQIGNYRVVQNPSGHHTIEHMESRETMHSVNSPTEEAYSLYVEQARLEELFQKPDETELVIWDVGLGSAFNAMATIHAYEKLDAKRPVRIVSFENDSDSLKLALDNTSLFHHLRHGAPVSLYKTGEWQSKKGPFSWKLESGDFLEKIAEAPAPDIIFFDPFSFKTNGPLWSLGCFQQIFDRCSDRATELFTYSSSTAVRAALLYCGFYVAKGKATGPKAHTTIALTPMAVKESRRDLLDSPWLEQWERSDAKHARDLEEEHKPHFEKKIREHAQFIVSSFRREFHDTPGSQR